MPFQLSTNYRLAVNKETAWGTPLTTGARFMRLVSSSINPTYQFMESEEMNAAHRETADTTMVSALGGGQIETEMSFGNPDAIMEAALGGTWTGTTTRTLKVGQSLKSLTFQEQYADITGNQFRVYAGAVVTGFTLDVMARQFIKFSAQFSSKQPTLAAATAVGTVAAAPTDPVMSPLAHLQTLTSGGTSIVAANSLTLTVQNDLIELPALLSADPLGMFQGRFRVTGSLTVWQQDAVLLNRLIAGNPEQFVLTVGGASNKRYALTLPKIKYTGVAMQGIRGSAGVQEQYSFSGLYDATNSSLQIVATD